MPMPRIKKKTKIAHDWVREICLTLPDTVETLTWGQPHFRVADKIFAGLGVDDGVFTLGFKLSKAHASSIISDPRFWPAKYVGRHGWVSMEANSIVDWDDIRELIHESYRLIAPKRSVKLWEEKTAGTVPTKKTPKTTKKRSAR